jgi:hypothetical protein
MRERARSVWVVRSEGDLHPHPTPLSPPQSQGQGSKAGDLWLRSRKRNLQEDFQGGMSGAIMPSFGEDAAFAEAALLAQMNAAAFGTMTGLGMIPMGLATAAASAEGEAAGEGDTPLAIAPLLRRAVQANDAAAALQFSHPLTELEKQALLGLTAKQGSHQLKTPALQHHTRSRTSGRYSKGEARAVDDQMVDPSVSDSDDSNKQPEGKQANRQNSGFDLALQG